MSYKKNFDFFVGGKTGIKGIKIDKKKDIIKNVHDSNSIMDVTTIAWGNDDEQEILIAGNIKDDRRIKIYDSESLALKSSFPCNVGQGNIIGISQYDRSTLVGVKSGEVSLQLFDGKEETLIKAGENLNKMRRSYTQKNIIATGGLENRLKLFDLEKQELIFSEKNLPHDFLELRVPIWISDLTFLPGTEQIVTVGRYGHVRLYDPNAQRRPVINLTIQDEALTCLSVTYKERHVIAGTGKGRMNLIDLRKPGTVLNTYKDFSGGVTDIVCSMNNPYIGSVSLDRYLRIHHINTKELLKKTYLVSRLTCLVMRSDFSMQKKN